MLGVAFGHLVHVLAAAVLHAGHLPVLMSHHLLVLGMGVRRLRRSRGAAAASVAAIKVIMINSPEFE